ncbi:hypothetical protein [Brevibacillus agri]|uniref:hypothetical protein n=1 Tax=Brevibacillus agri TaxID=51101 RepID=UPI003D70BCD2
MNIYEALKNIRWDYSEYFKYKFGIRYDQTKPPKSQEDFLRLVGKKTMNPYILWERTKEYKDLVALYLQSRVANDLAEVYDKVSTKAKQTADEKNIKLMLTLHKEINEHAKQAFLQFKDVEEEDDGLEL